MQTNTHTFYTNEKEMAEINYLFNKSYKFYVQKK